MASKDAVARKLALTGATADLARHFRAAEIPWILLKGPSLARWLYPDGGRDFGDIDVLIPHRAAHEVQKILASLGYEELRLKRTKRRRDIAGVFQREDDPIFVDLHIKLKGATESAEHQWLTLSRTTTTIQLTNEDVPVLGKPALAAAVAMHAAQHGTVPKPIQDLERALRVMSLEDWRAASEVARELGSLQYFAHGLRIRPDGKEVAAKLGLPHDITPDLLLRSEPRGSAASIATLVERPTWGERVRFAVDVLFPPRRTISNIYPSAERGFPWLLLAYGRRLIVLVIRMFRSLPAWWGARRRTRSATDLTDKEQLPS
jgi:hypothetical protein